MNLEKMERKRRELMIDFSEEELCNYIQQLTTQYYTTFFNKDVEGYYNTVNYLKETIAIFEVKYPELNNYINSCLVKSINKILSNSLSNNIDLVVFDTEETILSKSPVSDLIRAFDRSRELYLKDKENIKKVDELKKENERLKELLEDDHH